MIKPMDFGRLYFIHVFFNIWRIFLKTVGEVVSTLFRRLDWDQYGSICNGLEQVGGKLNILFTTELVQNQEILL